MFADEVGHAFDRVARAADACSRPTTRRILRVSAPTSFAMRWLIPRLDRFHADHPHVEVVVGTVSTLLEDLRGGFDIAIRRGNATEAAWPGHRAVRVIEDIDTLIASPALLERRPIRTPADIEGHVLLASETRAGDWTDWLDTAGLPHLVGLPRQTFDHFFVTRQAVEDGLGIGIGPLPMLAIDIAAGKLTTPLPEIQVRRTGYVAVVPDHAGRMPVIGVFIDWLADEGQRGSPAAPAGQKVLKPDPRDRMT
ncbi:LysR substrate-binding domain-containing protein [Sphingomonas abietis]|uniref:LysR substrate-binding domain-containing protein n=1 Tax=Sphingomonas abietis TaxID=3012344 RepID=A0ABY7NMZ7_9SPHN|nr:LysR substrate-binding domain-containing protein [Sphingomonas abietis]WBO22894.1 LysR substrate-binding domain-containing protein [Sphingomonas abietis]